MKTLSILLTSLLSLQYVLSRDYYIGMFGKGDFLVAQDNVYKERRPYSRVQADYGRIFKCKLTYFRVVDRLGMGPGPIVKVLKGGLQKKYIAIRIRSGYNLPISVNIYVGCENQNQKHRIPPIKATKPTQATTAPGEHANEPETTVKTNGNTDVPGAGSTTEDTTGDNAGNSSGATSDTIASVTTAPTTEI